ncbi:MAG TPA: DUF494 domain-containing protein [Thiotrichaceae bacterium]|nr:DUF494 domain-containing protein [Thiotrichaceae bacterium]
MKEKTLDVLFYLFDNISDYSDPKQNRSVLTHILQDAGFPNPQINKAFDWLESLDGKHYRLTRPQRSQSLRIFSERENRWLDTECQNHLIYLQNNDVLNPETREFIIDKVLTLRDIDFNLDKLKWIVMIILLNQPDKEAELTWMDSIALSEQPPTFH